MVRPCCRAPRKIFPPPTISATSIPRSCTSFTSLAIFWIVSAWMPKASGPDSDSPESFSTIRWKAGFPARAEPYTTLRTFFTIVLDAMARGILAENRLFDERSLDERISRLGRLYLFHNGGTYAVTPNKRCYTD